ncbi:MAG: TPM domain-containing protein [Pseudomonadota bacterium]|nr:TPM domain-containing protein [Pseudomonadota bacterium]
MRSMARWLMALPALLLVGALALAQELVAIPALQSHVTDQAALLTSAQRDALEQQLRDYESRTGSQIAVLLISSTAPEAIEQYSIRVADVWKLGRKNVDDGVLLIVAKDNPKALHRLRIEAGRGVQGSLTDLQSKRILQEVIAPYFQRSDFSGGLQAGVQAIMTLLDKEQLPAAPAGTPAQASLDGGMGIGIGVLMLLGLGLIIWQIRRQQHGGTLDRGSWGRSAGVIIGSNLGSLLSSGGGGGGGSDDSSSGSSSESGGGGSFDGGGASGDW